ncbi:nucleotidyltransferase family protein [Acidobacteria bacterium AB60]|nr:nucleotidyltransferase family protein [Acidobacteria bacterium AB60]
MWGIIPAAGSGSRIQPLAFSKELLPVGNRMANGREEPRAVSEYLVERMIAGGADKLCFVIAPNKTDILEYYGGRQWGAEIAFVCQPRPCGLCDAIFRAASFIHESETVVIGLPDTIWQPEDALRQLPDDELSFLLFPVEHPELFDAVETDEDGRVRRVHVKAPSAPTRWIWGAIKMPGSVFHALHALWSRSDRGDEFFGTLVNAWIDEGGRAKGIRAGTSYIDTGTLSGYRAAMGMLGTREEQFGSSMSKEEGTSGNEFAIGDYR